MRERIKINDGEALGDLIEFLRWCGCVAEPAGDDEIEMFANGDHDFRERVDVYIAWWRARGGRGLDQE